MALDHSRLGLENKSGRIFLRSTIFLYKLLPTNLGACKPTFHIFYTSHLRWNSAMSRGFYHTDVGQKPYSEHTYKNLDFVIFWVI